MVRQLMSVSGTSSGALHREALVRVAGDDRVVRRTSSVAAAIRANKGGDSPREIVARFHRFVAAAEAALEDFEHRFKDGGVPETCPSRCSMAPAAAWHRTVLKVERRVFAHFILPKAADDDRAGSR